MKRTLFIVSVLLLLICSCSFEIGKESVSKGNIKVTAPSDVVSDLSILSSLKSDISSSTAFLGLRNSSSTRGISSLFYGGELVTADKEDGKGESVLFRVSVDSPANIDRNGNVRKKGETVAQDDIPGSLDKMYVLGDYTILSYLTLDLDNLLNAENTELVTKNGIGKYSGSFDFSSLKDSVLKTLEFIYDEDNDFLVFSYTYSDPETGEVESVEEEKLYLRSDSNTGKLKSEDSGVSEFDISGYKNSLFRKNYLINNTTGLIYALPDGYDLSVHRGVIFDSTLGPLNIEENENGEIVLEQIILNSSLAVGDFFRDRYNQYYVLNDAADTIDTSLGEFSVMYYTTLNEYLPLSDGTVIHITFNKDTSYYGTNAITDVKRVGKDFIEEDIEGDVDISYSSLDGLDIADWLRDYNSRHSQKYCVDTKYGSGHFFDRIEDGYLYSYFCSNDFIAIFARTDLKSYDMTIREYFSNHKQNYFALLDANTLVIASNEFGENRKTYSLYLVKPFEEGEYREHYYDNILKSSGNLRQSPTYREFRDKYYQAFRNANSVSYTPDEIREKYQIDTSGTSPWVEGWQKIEGLSFDDGEVDSETLKTVYRYYQWKEGYSEMDFDRMYYDYVYKEDGVVKCDITQHVLLENVLVDSTEWKNADIYSLELKIKTYNSNSSYLIAKDDVSGEYRAEEAAKVILERRNEILQPVNRE